MLDIKKTVESFLQDQELTLRNISKNSDVIIKIVNALIEARDHGRMIYTMGNGGSGSTASHFVSDLLKTSIIKDKKRFSALSLVDNMPVMLAWANDSSYEDIFAEQLKNFLSNGDIIIGFSGSGKSKNVIKAFEYGRKNGAVCIGLTGMSGGEFPRLCDVCLIVPSNDMLQIESAHVVVCHCIVTTIRNLGNPLFTYE